MKDSWGIHLICDRLSIVIPYGGRIVISTYSTTGVGYGYGNRFNKKVGFFSFFVIGVIAHVFTVL